METCGLGRDYLAIISFSILKCVLILLILFEFVSHTPCKVHQDRTLNYRLGITLRFSTLPTASLGPARSEGSPPSPVRS